MSIHKSKQIVLQMCLICALVAHYAPNGVPVSEPGPEPAPLQEIQPSQPPHLDQMITIATTTIESADHYVCNLGSSYLRDSAYTDRIAEIGALGILDYKKYVYKGAYCSDEERINALTMSLIIAKQVIQNYVLQGRDNGDELPYSTHSGAGPSMIIKLPSSDGLPMHLIIHHGEFKLTRVQVGKVEDFIPGTTDYYPDANTFTQYVRQHIYFNSYKLNRLSMANNLYQKVLKYLHEAESQAKRQKNLQEARAKTAAEAAMEASRNQDLARQARQKAEEKAQQARQDAYRNSRQEVTDLIKAGGFAISGLVLHYSSFAQNLNMVSQSCLAFAGSQMMSVLGNRVYDRLYPMPSDLNPETAFGILAHDTALAAEIGAPTSEETLVSTSEAFGNADEVEGLRLRASQIASNQA